ncbi:amidohydrolase family protein [bacterium]|nr:amidohydrolase family protein [bacterium]
MIIKNANALLADDRLETTNLLIEDGKITGIGQCDASGTSIDAKGAYVLPGIIDIHTHGMGWQSAKAGSIFEYAKLEAQHGATTFLPTFFGSPDETCRRMLSIRAETDELMAVPNVGGFRLESPYLAQCGGGGTGDLAPISRQITDMLLEAGGGHIKIWDISPELPGAAKEIEYLSSRGVICSLAHTSASIDQARTAIDAGARLVTHLFDTFNVPEMTDPGVYPAGLADYLLVEDRVACEIIGDGTHVHPLLVEKAIRCKSIESIVFVTDSNYGAGLEPGDYELPGGWGRARVDGPNNGVRLIDKNMTLSGSALTPIDSFRNAIRIFSKDMATASRLCSTSPARLLNYNKGEIAVGRDADLVMLDKDLEVKLTIASGKIVSGSGLQES